MRRPFAASPGDADANAHLPRLVLAGLLVSFACDTATKQPAAPAVEQTPTPADPAPPEEEAPPSDDSRYATAGDIAYAEVMLGGARPDDEVPMIVAIHGLGDEPLSFSTLFATFPEPARLVLPRGLDETEGGGWSWFPIRARDGDIEGLAQGIRKAADTIAPAIAELARERPTRGKPVVTGFSQGGMLSFTIAVFHPDLIEAAVPVGGWLPPPLWPTEKRTQKSPRIVALHGTADNAVAFEPTKEATAHLKTLGWAVELKAYEGVRHVITPEIRRDLFDHLADAIRD
jgi:phospholipase/carboxylesterase